MSFKSKILPLKFANINLEKKDIEKGYYSKHKLNQLIHKKNQLRTYLIDFDLKICQNIKIIKKKFKFPIILKPDWGESSIAVKKIKNEFELNSLLKKVYQNKIDFIVQEYSNLKYEIDILYLKDLKNSNQNKIIDITQVINPVVIGNGKDNLKTLINNNFENNLKYLLELNKNNLDKVFKKDKKIILTKINSMLYNSKFKDISKNFSNNQKIQILKNITKYKKFKFAKVTIKINNYNDLLLGKFKVIETNILFPLKSSLILNEQDVNSYKFLLEIKKYINKLIPILKEENNTDSFFNLSKFYIKNYIHKKKIKKIF